MTFQKEADFEEALIKVLADKGWEKEVIKNPTEQDLIRNWAKILYDNNRGIDRLNNYPLTDGEMQQIIEQITELRTPLKLNGFIFEKFYRFSDYLGTTPQMSELLGLSSISGILRFGRYPAYHGISEPHLAVKSSKTVVENRPYY